MLKRSPLRRADPTARASVPVHRPKKCAVKSCKAQFTPSRSFEVWCSPSCGLEIAQDKKRKAAEKAALADRRETRAKLNALKPLSHWLALTQDDYFNPYIRARDADLPCISCGRDNGSKMNAGHYLSVGSHPELRFDEANVHKQCEYCNGHKAGNAVAYRIRLIERIGLAEVERLEGPHPAAKFTREQLAEMRAHYRALTKELTK